MTDFTRDWETRDEGDPDPLAAATAAVDELRAANETFRTQQTTMAERHATEVRTLTERLAGLETRLNRPGGGQHENRTEPTVEVRAFDGFVRRGREMLGADEIRALRTDSQPAGGYLAPDQFEATLLRELVEISPMRQAARVTQVSSGGVILPKRTGRITAKWVGETEERPGTEPTYGQIQIEAHEMACWVDVSNRLLEDAAINIEQELAFDFAEEFGRLEGLAFVSGDGIKKPVSIMVDPNVASVVTGDAAKVTPDSLIELVYALPQVYRNRGSFVMNARTIAALRKFKDAGGNYLWVDGSGTIADGQSATLLGRPVIEAPDLPDIGAGTTPIAYGDFGAAYRIIDRVGLSVLRDPYTQQTNGIVRFHARRRVGAGVVRPEAIRKLKIAAASLELGVPDQGALIAELILRASATVEAICGRSFALERVRESSPSVLHSGGSVTLSRWPIVEIHSVTSDGHPLTDDGYCLDHGILTGAFGRVVAEYTAGYVLPGEEGRDLPHDIERVVIALVKNDFLNKDGQAPLRSFSVDGAFAKTYFERQGIADAMPLLAPYRLPVAL